MFGGCPKWEKGKSLAKTTVLDFGEQNTHSNLRAAKLTGLSSFKKSWKLPLYTPLVQILQVKFVPGSTIISSLESDPNFS